MSYCQETINYIADLTTIQDRDRHRYPYLLDSVAKDNQLGRYSILFAFPQQVIECDDLQHTTGFLQQLELAWQQRQQDFSDSQLPFTGGWFVYLGYESVAGIETTLQCPSFLLDFPVAFAAYCPAAIVSDHVLEQSYCVCQHEFAQLVEPLQNDILKPATAMTRHKEPVFHAHEDEAEEYIDGVNAILEYIRAGDVFQVNLSRAWQVKTDAHLSSSDIYARLCSSNPAPFACLVHHERGSIISSSPERLVRVRGRTVETRPIAGTRPRTNDSRDAQWLDELRTDIKEQAEHIMLIDLERNDLGRVCEAGSIKVDELMALESYAHVHHIVSNVSGRLRSEVTPVDVLRAVFPGGTITGCPKVRCMEIIAELEQQGRGPYTGSVGYINNDGSMDFNILIRTMFKQHEQLYFRAGAGIVADSRPYRELDETRHKAKGMLMALGAT